VTFREIPSKITFIWPVSWAWWLYVVRQSSKGFDPLLAWERICTYCSNEVFLDHPEGLLGIAPSQGVFSDVNQKHPSSSSNNLVCFTYFCALTFNTITFSGPKAAVVPLLTNSRSSFNKWGIPEEEQIILLPPGVFLIWKNLKYQFWSSFTGLAL